ncbi:hypothetical protein ABTY61_39575 [Kitasatospora sp. NPDC096128]|uniref:hypothetical protein n=1 Tax=Kitasatospora sp. NPDC096128 TaxID=3155547 RepID=UPI0033302BF0
MSGGRRRPTGLPRLMRLAGLTGRYGPAGRRAAAVDLAVLLAVLVATALVCRGLGLGTWLAILLGGCAGAATTRLGLGARLVRRGRD